MGSGISKPAGNTTNANESLVDKILAAKIRNPDNLMAKHFSEAYYNSLPADKKALLLKICKSGAENVDSGLGMYAQQPGDYDTFFEYFDKVIREYHKIKDSTSSHVNNWDLSTRKARLDSLGCTDGKLDLSKLGLGKTSMRVRVGRNLASFPLPGSMTRDDRVKMETKMIGAFKTLMADAAFGGTYHSLTPGNPHHINDAKYKELVNDHIMFKDMAADKYLNSAGISADWPYGRGCYVSQDKEFIVWVGEEDHLRIMCMKKGVILNEVFDRLQSAEQVVEKHAGPFAKSKSYGYVTSCPTNLGTGMRASLHIQLPFLTSDGTDKKAKAICKPLGLSVRGLGGEHTPIGSDGTVDISPSARLMIEEADIICALYEGIKNLLEAEKKAKDELFTTVLAKIQSIKTSHPDNLMARHFDPEYFATLPEDKKLQLLKICKSGYDNADSGLGMYAMNPGDYETFAPIFDKVIRAYHKIEGEKTHVTNWDLKTKSGKLADLGITDGQVDLAKLGLEPVSMRVRVGRNLATFPLPGAMTKDDRINMENTMIKAFKNLIADKAFGGTYHSLTPGNPYFISNEKYQELVNAHVMFKDMSADPYLNSAGISSNWPYGRGCYVSADKEFIVWVGEEDHLRIMCMMKGTVFNKVFNRLESAEKIVEKYADKFARSQKYGFVTSCPTNLGTGMRASVHIKLPALTSDGTDKKAKAICKPLGLSVRGLGGEHTPIGSDGTVDISPSARLMIEEADIICALYEGIKNLLEAEKKAKEEMIAAALEKIQSIKTSHPDNLMAHHFDPEYFATLPEDKKLQLLKICKSGYDNADSGLGMYAMNPGDYETFAPIFDKVIRAYHKIEGEKTHVTNWDLKTKAKKLADLGITDGQVDLAKLGLEPVSMRVRVGRNLATFPLPGAMTKDDRINMENTMIKAFKNLIADKAFGGTYHSLTPGNPYFISNEKYQELVNAHIMFKDMSADPYLNSAGISSNWPYGRGCYVSEDKEFIVWVGEEDHLRIMCMMKGTVFNKVFNRLESAEKVVEKYADKFARSKKYGFVTSCPTNLGTGMRASVHIKLPALTSDGTDKKAKAICKPLGLSVRGLGGEHTPIGSDGTVDISPSARLMIEEADIICALYEGIKNLLEEENKAKL